MFTVIPQADVLIDGEKQVLDENTLLNKARNLDRIALTQIHDQYYASIYRYISFRVSDPQSVEDMTSEVFTRFLHALHKSSSVPRTIRNWLYGTASNLVKEYYRSQKRTPEDLDESLPDRGIGPEQHIEEKWTAERLREALKELTEDQQNILALRFGEELPVREVARTMNKTEGAVKMLQVRAISALARNFVNGRNL